MHRIVCVRVFVCVVLHSHDLNVGRNKQHLCFCRCIFSLTVISPRLSFSRSSADPTNTQHCFSQSKFSLPIQFYEHFNCLQFALHNIPQKCVRLPFLSHDRWAFSNEARSPELFSNRIKYDTKNEASTTFTQRQAIVPQLKHMHIFMYRWIVIRFSVCGSVLLHTLATALTVPPVFIHWITQNAQQYNLLELIQFSSFVSTLCVSSSWNSTRLASIQVDSVSFDAGTLGMIFFVVLVFNDEVAIDYNNQ